MQGCVFLCYLSQSWCIFFFYWLLQSVVVDTRVIIVAWQLTYSHTSFSLSISEWLSASQVSLQHARKPFAHVPSLLESLQQTLSSKPQDFCHILNCEACLISAFPVAASLVLHLKQLWRNISLKKCKCIYPYAIQDVDEFVSSSEQIWRNEASHHLLTSEWVPSEWVQIADTNITIIHTSSVQCLKKWKVACL